MTCRFRVVFGVIRPAQGRHVDLPRIQPVVNQLRIQLRERQPHERHFVEIVNAPTGPHNAALRTPVDSQPTRFCA